MGKRNDRFINIGFDIGLLMKGLNAILEIIGGIAMVFLSPARANQLITHITAEELAEDPNDFLMNYLIRFGQSYSISTQNFMIIYLLSHGIVKLVIILLLWRNVLWAYPLSVVVFIGFISYQMYHFTISHSVALLLLTFLDLVLVVLTILKYKEIKGGHNVR